MTETACCRLAAVAPRDFGRGPFEPPQAAQRAYRLSKPQGRANRQIFKRWYKRWFM